MVSGPSRSDAYPHYQRRESSIGGGMSETPAAVTTGPGLIQPRKVKHERTESMSSVRSITPP